MTVAALPASVSYAENGVTTAFAAPFRFKAASDLIVERIVAGVVTPLALGVDYTVTGGMSDAGGTVTRTAATNGATLRIRRRTARAQAMVYTAGDRFPAKSHEGALDTAMLIDQEQDDTLADVTGRALMVPVGEAATVLPTAAARAGALLSFDALGRAVASVSAIAVAQLIAIGFTPSLAQLAANVGYLASGVGPVVRSVQSKLDDYWVSVKDFGAKGDGVTDETTVIQAGLNWLALHGGGTLFFPDGVYPIGGALQDVANSNAQIVLPKVSNPGTCVSIRLRGSTAPITTWASNSGAILESTLGVGNGQMIGVNNPHASTGDVHDRVSWIGLYIEDLTLRMPQNASNSALDLSYVPMSDLRNVRVDVQGGVGSSGPAPVFTMAQPTTATSYGIKGPLNDVPIWNNYDNVMVSGFYTGIRMGELWGGNNLTALACKRAIEVPQHRHPGAFGRIVVCNSPTTLVATGPAEINIQMLDIEHDTAAGSGPPWVEPFVADIYDPNNYLRGRVTFHMHDTSIPFTVVGAGNLRIEENTVSHINQYPAPNLFPGFFPLDPAIETTRRGLAGAADADRAAFAVLASTRALATGGLIGGWFGANEAIADGSDKRLGGMFVETQGGIDGGCTVLGSKKPGVDFIGRWEVSNAGDFGPRAKGLHLVQIGGANGDLGGTVAIAAATSVTVAFTRAFAYPPAVVATPQGDLGAGVRYWVTPTVNGFTITTSSAVTSIFAYHIVGNPN